MQRQAHLNLNKYSEKQHVMTLIHVSTNRYLFSLFLHKLGYCIFGSGDTGDHTVNKTVWNIDYPIIECIPWATTWQNQQNDMYAQRSHRSAWTSAQSDQSSLSAWRKLGSLATHWAHSEDSNQIGRMLRLVWFFAGHTGHFIGFVRWRFLLFYLQFWDMLVPI